MKFMERKIFIFVEFSLVCNELICFLSVVILFWFFFILSESWVFFFIKFYDIFYVKIEVYIGIIYYIIFNIYYLINFYFCQLKVFGLCRFFLKRSIRDLNFLVRQKKILFVLVKIVIGLLFCWNCFSIICRLLRDIAYCCSWFCRDVIWRQV